MSWKNMFLRPADDEPVGSEEAPSSVDIEALLASTREMTGGATPAVETATPAVGAASVAPTATLEENRPFSDIYSEHYVPPSPKTVDEILAFLQGISNMPPAAQAQVIKAMDDADDNWAMSDVIGDAQAKIDALNLAKQGLDGRLEASLSASQARLVEADTAISDARTKIGASISKIEKQIAELQAQITEFNSLLREEEALQEAAKSAATEEQATARAAAHREAARYDAEITRLTKFITTFSN